jgi:dihydroflavonol-4-reductase
MKYLITGATGFIGPYLVRKLISEGHTCRCFVRSIGKGKSLLGPDIELVKGDITKEHTLRGVAKGMDGVYHLATLGHMHNFDTPQNEFENVNVHGTINIMKEALRAGIKKVVHCSSTAAMGITKNVPADEKCECNPHHSYGISKLHGENKVLDLFRKRGLPAVIIRFSMVYGPGVRHDIIKLARLAKKRIIPKIGSRPKLTPLIHVDDAVEGLLLAMEKGKAGEAYLITNAQSEPFDRVVKIIKDAEGIPDISLYVPEWAALSAASMIECMSVFFGRTPIITRKNIESTIADRVFSIDKARKDLGFEPRIDPEEGLKETVQWYLKNGWV